MLGFCVNQKHLRTRHAQAMSDDVVIYNYANSYGT